MPIKLATMQRKRKITTFRIKPSKANGFSSVVTNVAPPVLSLRINAFLLTTDVILSILRTETVEVVGDLCRALGPYIAKYCDKILFFLLNDLQAQNLHRSVKPSILSCFGDIALAIEGQFEKYLPYALTMLGSASDLSIQTQQVAADDDDMIDYNNALRNGILEAYSGLFQGFKSNKQQLSAFHDHAREIIGFIESIYQDPNRSDSVTKNAVWVLGDLADTLENVGPFFAEKPFYQKFLMECKQDASLGETAQWALNRISMRGASL